MDGDLSIWDMYIKANLARPQNVSQLWKWAKTADNVRSLRFFEAKKVFTLKSMEKNSSKDIEEERQELVEWIGDCKEELICIRSDELQNEDDFEESMEELQIKFTHLLNKLHETKQQLLQRHQQRYDKVKESVKSQQQLLQQTLRTLTNTLEDCDIKCDKQEVQDTLSSIPEFTEIEYNRYEIDLVPLKKEITKLSRESVQRRHRAGTDSKQLLDFKVFSEFKNDDEVDNDHEDEVDQEPDERDEVSEEHPITERPSLHIEPSYDLNFITEDVEQDELKQQATPHDLFSPTSPFTHHPRLSNPFSNDLTLRLHVQAPSLGSLHSADENELPFTSLLSPSSTLSVHRVSQKKKKKKKVKRKDFQFLSVIGRGTFGKIVLVKKKADGIKYAMKVLKKTQIIALKQEDNINTEIRVLKTIKHPFLLRAHYVFQTESKIYLALDYYRFGDLMSHLKLKRKFSEMEAKHIISEVGLAIGALHSHGIVYRDLKPENLLMDAKGHICLCDFGLCKKVGLGTMSTFCGTPDYLAPEILKRDEYDKNVDWWSYGILLFELIVGIVPFYSASNMQMYNKIKEQKLMFPSYVNGECRDLISKLLNRDPSERLGAADDVNDIRKHAWFEDINWVKILEKQIEPPYRPGMANRAQSECDSDYDESNNNNMEYTDHDNDYDNQIDSNSMDGLDRRSLELTPTPTPRLDKGILANYAI